MINYLKDKTQNGFSLVELIMVMVILGILASVAIPKMTNVLDKAELRAEQAVVNQIWAGCESYANDRVLEDGNEAWPYHPLTIFGRTRNIKITLDLDHLKGALMLNICFPELIFTPVKNFFLL